MSSNEYVACPACSILFKVSKSVFGSDFHCPNCDAGIEVSAWYTRSLVLLSVLLGYALAWRIGLLGPRSPFFDIPWGFFLLWAPLGFLILTLLLRTVPFLIKPTLVLRSPGHVMTLNLRARPKDDGPR
jgi:hypothetical protein